MRFIATCVRDVCDGREVRVEVVETLDGSNPQPTVAVVGQCQDGRATNTLRSCGSAAEAVCRSIIMGEAARESPDPQPTPGVRMQDHDIVVRQITGAVARRVGAKVI